MNLKKERKRKEKHPGEAEQKLKRKEKCRRGKDYWSLGPLVWPPSKCTQVSVQKVHARNEMKQAKETCVPHWHFLWMNFKPGISD